MGDEKRAVFSLYAVITAIETASDENRWFANARTGEVASKYDYMSDLSDIGDEELESGEWLRLPERYDRNDWAIMRDFAVALGGRAGDELLDAIHGNGAFRAFRREVEQLDALQSWYAYKDARIYGLAVEWLERNGLEWDDDRFVKDKPDWRELLPDALKNPLRLTVLDCELSVCKYDAMPATMPGGRFCSIVRTEDEVSVVCETAEVPDGAKEQESGWRALKVCGPLDFGLVGILANISSALADADVPIFAISTYDTDYVLVKDEMLETAVDALRYEGCAVE